MREGQCQNQVIDRSAVYDDQRQGCEDTERREVYASVERESSTESDEGVLTAERSAPDRGDVFQHRENLLPQYEEMTGGPFH